MKSIVKFFLYNYVILDLFMKKILFILLLSFSFTAALLVPEEYGTIQEAIDYPRTFAAFQLTL